MTAIPNNVTPFPRKSRRTEHEKLRRQLARNAGGHATMRSYRKHERLGFVVSIIAVAAFAAGAFVMVCG
jgi:hypothetical protein